MNHSYWHIQTTEKPLFPDIEWNRPEQRAHAGKLVIIGGNKLGFTAISEAYAVAEKLGAGQKSTFLNLRKMNSSY